MTVPFDDPTVAIEVAELDQVPPVVVLVHVWEEPAQTGVVPEMVCNVGAVTEIVLVPVLTHAPAVTLYVIRDVPAPTAVITPDEVLIVATPVLELVHVPPLVVPDHVAVEPTHSGVVPVIV